MASYHHSITYRDYNSFDDYGLIIVAFEPDNGFKDTFLGMDNISDEYYDGTKKFNYGSKYNSSAEIQISFIKKDGTDMTMQEFRDCAKWLTGARIDSWLDMYIGKASAPETKLQGNGKSNEFVINKHYNNILAAIVNNNPNATNKYKNVTNKCKYVKSAYSSLLTFDFVPENGAEIIVKESPIYSFLGKVTNLEQYKYDARTTGIRITFSSVSPWAFSAPQLFTCEFGQVLSIEEDANINVLVNNREKMIVDNGVLCPSASVDSHFMVQEVEDGLAAYIDTSYNETIINESDDLYTYTYLDIDYKNQTKNTNNKDEIYIENKTLGEKTIVKGIAPKENITLSSKQFIVSSKLNQVTGKVEPNTTRIFGDDFNFVWPRLIPGKNDFSIYGTGLGIAEFTYRYPMKIGDCAIDLDSITYC